MLTSLELWDSSKVQAGNLYVNRAITGAIVQRQPFGGWKKSTVGSGTKAGGPSYLIALSDWEPAQATATATTQCRDRSRDPGYHRELRARQAR